RARGTPRTVRSPPTAARWNSWSLPQLRVERFTQRLTQQGEAERGDDDAEGRVDGQGGSAGQKSLCFGEHRAPFREGRVRVSEAGGGQGGRVDEGCGQGERGLHDHRSHGVGQDVGEGDLAFAYTQCFGGQDVFAGARGEHGATQQAGEDRDLCDTDREHDRGEAGADERGDGDG